MRVRPCVIPGGKWVRVRLCVIPGGKWVKVRPCAIPGDECVGCAGRLRGVGPQDNEEASELTLLLRKYDSDDDDDASEPRGRGGRSRRNSHGRAAGRARGGV